MTTHNQVTTYEALCSAFYHMPFAEFLGEKDMPVPNSKETERTAWFHLGEKPKDMQVAFIIAENDTVLVKARWRNYFADGRNPLLGTHNAYIDAQDSASDNVLRMSTERAIVRVLELFRDVVAETGVAGNLADLNKPTEEVTDGEEA